MSAMVTQRRDDSVATVIWLEDRYNSFARERAIDSCRKGTGDGRASRFGHGIFAFAERFCRRFGGSRFDLQKLLFQCVADASTKLFTAIVQRFDKLRNVFRNLVGRGDAAALVFRL